MRTRLKLDALYGVLCCVIAISMANAPLAEEPAQAPGADPFAAAGHPQTKLCPEPHRVGVFSRAMNIQFQPKASSSETQAEAIALVGLIGPAVDQQGVRYLALTATNAWASCASTRSPDFLFWRDADGNWRMPKGPIQTYLEQHLQTLPAEKRNSPVAAYVLYFLGDTLEFDGGDGLEEFEEAFELIQTHGDPNGVLRHVAASLILQQDRGSPQPEWLDAYAKTAEASGEAWDQIPIVKVSPVYPKLALSRGRTGYVVLRFTVDEEGHVRDPQVIEEDPKGVFSRAAITAALKFRYLPKVVNGKRVPVDGVRNRIDFDIR